MADRFFRVTALAGRLHISDLPDFGPWEVIRKVRTVEELDGAIGVSEGEPGSIGLYVHEILLNKARDRWEEMRESPSTV